MNDVSKSNTGKLIQKRKVSYAVSKEFDQYLIRFGRSFRLPLDYDDLFRYGNALTLYDKLGQDTLWNTVSYASHEQEEIHAALLKVYALLRSEGDASLNRHLYVDRIDICLYGNSKPFRVRIMNALNDNFDYFYVKKADASRLLGLELEHILSPNRIGFISFQNTVIEEHILGIPGDMFAARYWGDLQLNEVRLAKEFVKFNERCLLRLLGDMHDSNFVVDVTLDVDANTYRIRAIDFDQQSYEPQLAVYRPEAFPNNAPYRDLVQRTLHVEAQAQYQREERALMRRRMKAASQRLHQLMETVHGLELAPKENVKNLGEELANYYRYPEFTKAKTMGQLVSMSLTLLEQKL